ncbi:MAG: hypothetical protein D6806_18665 [Deltaproteobacteria bacterium]|nr:MAG: hypothetical protein D6806_18665 [Deltaproteobacteria bacterium]
MAAAMGYEHMSNLAHRMEDLVAPSGRPQDKMAPEHVEILMQGLDVLKQQLDAVAAGSAVPPPPEKLMIGLATTSTSSDNESPKGSTQETGKPEQSSWILRFSIDPDAPSAPLRARVILSRLAKIGSIGRTIPDQGQLNAGQIPENELELELYTTATRQELERLASTFPEVTSFSMEERKEHVPRAENSPALFPAVRRKMDTVRVQTDLLDFFFDVTGELITLATFFEDATNDDQKPALRHATRRLGQLVRKMRERVMEVRMVPASLLTVRLERACRQLARRQGKLVEFRAIGQEVELDRALVEVLDGALVHIIRNAVDHGVEQPQLREAKGKPAQATVTVSFDRVGERVRVKVADDGAGIDVDRVRKRALELGWISKEQDVPAERVFDFLFRPGFSTAESVSDVSGRGVGLDAVRNMIERIGGRVSVASEAGQGTRFSLDLPLTLALMPVLLVEQSGALLGIPARDVERVISITQEDTARLSEFHSLSALLGERENRKEGECVVVKTAEDARMGIAVARVSGHREVVVKPLGKLLGRIGPYSGAAVLGDGRPLLLLDLNELARRAGGLHGS